MSIQSLDLRYNPKEDSSAKTILKVLTEAGNSFDYQTPSVYIFDHHAGQIVQVGNSDNLQYLLNSIEQSQNIPGLVAYWNQDESQTQNYGFTENQDIIQMHNLKALNFSNTNADTSEAINSTYMQLVRESKHHYSDTSLFKGVYFNPFEEVICFQGPNELLEEMLEKLSKTDNIPNGTITNLFTLTTPPTFSASHTPSKH